MEGAGRGGGVLNWEKGETHYSQIAKRHAHRVQAWELGTVQSWLIDLFIYFFIYLFESFRILV